MCGAGPWRQIRRRLAPILVVAAVCGSWTTQAQNAPPSPEVRIEIESDAAARDRLAAAAAEALSRYAEWLGPLPFHAVVVQPLMRGGARPEPGRIAVDLALWNAAPTMEVEAQVAYLIAREYWRPGDSAGAPDAVFDGLSWFLQSLVVERLFNQRYFTIAYNTDSVRFFGGHIPWALPTLRLGRSSAGLGRDVYLRRDQTVDCWPALGRRLPRSMHASALRVALGFGSLERYLGWPVLQGALRAVAGARNEGALTPSRVAEILSAAAGQDLSWFLTPLFSGTERMDYAVASWSTQAGAPACTLDDCYRTQVVVSRLAPFAFTGTARLPEGSFDAGVGLSLRVGFDDGQVVTTSWDGRAEEREFEFQSPSPAATVKLDPDGVLLLDDTLLDHQRSATSRTNTPIGKWVARWAVWLQDAMLTYAMLL